MKICTVFPARNEGESIGALVRSALRFGRVIVVDDNSTDDTAREAKLAGAEVVRPLVGKRGLSDVYRRGLLRAFHRDEAGFDYIFEVDAGGSHDPVQIERFIPHLEQGVDVVFGVRFGPGASYTGSLKRKVLSYVGTIAANVRYKTWFRDSTSGFIAYSRQAIALTHGREFESVGHYYQTEVRARVLKLGLRWSEVPIDFKSTNSSLNRKSIYEAAAMLLRGV